MDFGKQFMGTFEISEKDRFLYDLAQQYHERCEAYDQTVCTGRRDGIAIPRDSEQLGLINRHALQVRRELLQQVLAKGLTKNDFIRAIQRKA